MTKTKYIYSVYDLMKKSHIAFFSSLDKAGEFVSAHQIKTDRNFWATAKGMYTGKHNAAYIFRANNYYCEPNNHFSHIYVKIPLDENGQIKFQTW